MVFRWLPPFLAALLTTAAASANSNESEQIRPRIAAPKDAPGDTSAPILPDVVTLPSPPAGPVPIPYPNTEGPAKRK